MRTSIEAKVYDQKEGQTDNNSCSVSVLIGVNIGYKSINVGVVTQFGGDSNPSPQANDKGLRYVFFYLVKMAGNRACPLRLALGNLKASPWSSPFFLKVMMTSSPVNITSFKSIGQFQHA